MRQLRKAISLTPAAFYILSLAGASRNSCDNEGGAPLTQLRDALVWDAYWNIPGVKATDADRPVAASIFWNDSLAGFCAAKAAACEVYEFDPRTGALGPGLFYQDRLDSGQSDLNLQQDFLKRFVKGAGSPVIRIIPSAKPAFPLPGPVDAPPDPAVLSAATRSRGERVSNSAPTVRTCRTEDFIPSPAAPRAVREKHVPSGIDSLVEWWRVNFEVNLVVSRIIPL